MSKEQLEGNLLARLAEDNVIGTPAILARRKCLEQVGGFDERLRCLEDWDMVCRIAEQWEIGFVDEVLVDAHDSEGSVTYNIKNHMETRCQLIARYRYLLAENNVLEKAIVTAFAIAQDNGYLEETKKLLSEVLNLYEGSNMDRDALRDKIDEMLRTHSYDQIEAVLMEYKDITEHDNDLVIVYYLMRVYKKEKNAGQKTILDKTGSISALLERYTILKFYLRRIDFDVIDESLQDFYRYVVQNGVSVYELLTVLDYSVIHKDKVLNSIKGII